MSPIISVIIPLYNREKYIEECIRSVIATGYENLEIIVIDDGSDDQGPQLVQQIIDSGYQNIRLLFHPGRKNKGVSASRNLGIKECRGMYVAFIDSDDVMKSSRFSFSPGVLDQNPSVDAVHESAEICNANDDIIERLVQMKGCLDDYVSGRIRYDIPGIPGTGAFLFRKSIFAKSGLFNERKTIGEDFDLWYRVYAIGHIVPDNRAGPVCRYRKHSGNTIVEDSQMVHLDGFAELYEWSRSRQCDPKKCGYLKNRYTAHFYDYFGVARSQQDLQREKELLCHAIMHLPSLLLESRYVRCWGVYMRDVLRSIRNGK